MQYVENFGNLPKEERHSWYWLFGLFGFIVLFGSCMFVFLAMALPDRPNYNTTQAPKVESTEAVESVTETTIVTTVTPMPTFEPVITVTSLPAIDGIGANSTGVVIGNPSELFNAQSGAIPTTAPTAVPPAIVITSVQDTVQTTPVWNQPVATAVPLALPPSFGGTLPMPPLSVTAPDCGFNPIYMGYDPRVGCRVPAGITIVNAELWVNGVLQNMTISYGWEAPSTPVTAQPGQMILWTTYGNNIACVTWNPSIPLGTTDIVVMRLHTNAATVIDGRITVRNAYDAGHMNNPYPIAHACGYSPDRTYLRAEIGDTLNRFIMGLDIQPTDEMYQAWYQMYGSYELTVGQNYAVPPQWLGGTFATGTK